MSAKDDFNKQEIESLDQKIAEATEKLAALEEGHYADKAELEKLTRILNAKIKDWKNKRELLFNHRIGHLKIQ